MRGYDLVVIYRPGIEETVLEEHIEKVSSMVQDSGGETIEINRWGKKPLGYEIGGERSGIYVVFKFRTESSILSGINKELNLNESVLRQRVLLSGSAPETAPEEEAEEDQDSEEELDLEVE